jgi:hypothetical protein
VKDAYKQYLIGFLLNLLAGILLYFLLPILQKNLFALGVTIGTTAVTFACIFLTRRYRRFRHFGIARMLPSVNEGKGSTASILKSVEVSFAFMGIAARRWINTEPVIDRLVKEICNPNRPVRFLLLDPDSQEAVRQSKVLNGNDRDVPDSIRRSLNTFKSWRANGCNIEVKLYNFLPVFRIAMVDDDTAYVGFYRGGMARTDSPQLVLDHEGHPSFFQPFKDYFEMNWAAATEVDWAKVS